MMVRGCLRVWLLLVGVLLVSSHAFAHSLPGSVLTFSREGEWLNVNITFPLEDLIIADDEFSPLADLASAQDLSSEYSSRLAAYFDQHLALRQANNPLQLTLIKASLKKVHHHDLGEFMQLASTLKVRLTQQGQLFPLTLHYDAVMHEVRSHNARVYWRRSDNSLVKLASFHYWSLQGKPADIVLEAP